MPSPEVSNPGPSPEPINYKELEEEEFSDEEQEEWVNRSNSFGKSHK